MKTKLRNCLLILLGVFVFSSCTTDKTMIAKGVNLNKYQYASITQSEKSFGPVAGLEIEPGIYNAIEATRLQMIGERRLGDLPDNQKEKLVLVKYSTATTPESSTIIVSFEDYMTGKTISSCKVSKKGLWNRQKDVDKSIRRLAGRIADVWK